MITLHLAAVVSKLEIFMRKMQVELISGEFHFADSQVLLLREQIRVFLFWILIKFIELDEENNYPTCVTIWKGKRQIFPRVIWLHMYYEKNITGKLSPVHTFAITCLISLLEHAQGPKTPRPIRDQDYHHVIG